MQSYEALQRAIAGKTIEHAKRQRKSTSLINKWQEPATDFTDSGTTNPIDRVETTIETALSLGIQREDALAPIDYLEHRFGRVGIDLPAPDVCNGELTQDLIRMIGRFGDLTKKSAQHLADHRITRAEWVEQEECGMVLVRQIVGYLQHVKSAVGK